MHSSESPTSTPSFSTITWGESLTTSKSDIAEKFRARKELKNSRRRIVRACMRCRLRKTKCDGGKPCTRCTEADDVCEYMKCTKRESKEYPQDYVERLLEQNDKYKTAMRVLYANRRLSIQPDSIVIPNAESDDVPLVHDILERLGLLDQRINNPTESTESRVGTPSSPCVLPTTLKTQFSTSSQSASLFDHNIFSASPSTIPDSEVFPDFEIPALPKFSAPEPNLSAWDMDIGMDFPYHVLSSLDDTHVESSNFLAGPEAMDMSSLPDPRFAPQDWCPLEVLANVMNDNVPLGDMWMDDGFEYQAGTY